MTALRSPLLALVVAACSAGGDDETTAPASSTSSASAPTSGAADPTTGADADDTSTTSISGGTGDGTTGTAAPSTGDEPDPTTGADPTTGEPVDDPRLATLVTHAPRVWLHPNEQYFPSSVEFAFAAMTRFVGGDSNYWLRSTDALASPSDTLPFFAGDLDHAPVYAYYADKGGGVVDLVYFFWYPYNRGKEVVDTIWGNHVGDWEHITVRLLQDMQGELVPDQVYLSAHDFGGAYAWADIEKFESTHPVVYAAWGSHGVWKDPGDHVYMTIGEEVLGVCVTLVCADLTDETAPGVAWDTWTRVAGFDYAAKQGLGAQTWPVWMREDFAQPGDPPADEPGHGPIYRWGNAEDCSTLGVDISDLIGVCRLEDGPTGPASKGVWGPELQ